MTNRSGVLACVLLASTLACGSPTGPSVDLSGTWDFTFSAQSAAACPGLPGLLQGCGGAGVLEITRSIPGVAGTYTHRSGCQTCRGAADYAASGVPLTNARLVGSTFEFTIADCRLVAPVTAGPAASVSGDVTCLLDPASGLEVRGLWRMTRSRVP